MVLKLPSGRVVVLLKVEVYELASLVIEPVLELADEVSFVVVVRVDWEEVVEVTLSLVEDEEVDEVVVTVIEVVVEAAVD